MDVFSRFYLNNCLNTVKPLNIEESSTIIDVIKLTDNDKNIIFISNIRRTVRSNIHYYGNITNTWYYKFIYRGHLVFLLIRKNKINSISEEFHLTLHHAKWLDSSVFDDLIKQLKGE